MGTERLEVGAFVQKSSFAAEVVTLKSKLPEELGSVMC